jgi:hypothetical protein
MSNIARTDEIDELVSSVRNFVAHKDQKGMKPGERLVLMPDQRVSEEDMARLEAVTHALYGDGQPKVAREDNVLILGTEQAPDKAKLEATIAELEAAVTAQSDDWEADEGEEFATSAWAASAFEKPSASLAAAQLDTVKVAAAPAKVADTTDSDDAQKIEDTIVADLTAGMDEAALRALVVAMVHEELGGELGEKITRNVRKLVRREIHRVLTSRELGEE